MNINIINIFFNNLGFGVWRFFLAFLVAISHLWSNMIHGPAAYAVWGFFVLSGFLMTLVLNEKYGFSKNGLLKYFFNRFLRIFPLYWLSCVIGIFVLLYSEIIIGISAKSLNPAFSFPTNALDVAYNITLMPFIQSSNFLVPVSSALAIEVGVYILIPFLAVNRSTALFALIISLIINLNYSIVVDTFITRYTSFNTCLFAFAMGSSLYHYRDSLQAIKSPCLSIFAWLMHCLFWIKFPYYPWEAGLYVSVILSCWVILSIFKTKENALGVLLGNLSYPIYLIHTSIGIVLFPYFNSIRTFNFFLISFLLTLLVSLVMHFLFEKNIQRYKWKK